MRITHAEVERRIAGFKDACHKAAVKLTHQRLNVFREVAASGDHPDAETVFSGVRRRLPTISLDTVYRTLWLLNSLGLIETLGPRRESVRFDANLAPHHHYVCAVCGLARDFNSKQLDRLRVPASVKQFGSIHTTQVHVHGLCNTCAKKRPNKPAGRSQARKEKK